VPAVVKKQRAVGDDIPGAKVPVALFNPGHIPIWESLVQGVALEMNFEPAPFPFQTEYSRYQYNCYLWTGRASLIAVGVSILPAPKQNGGYF
jgi:hypothetical protein